MKSHGPTKSASPYELSYADRVISSIFSSKIFPSLLRTLNRQTLPRSSGFLSILPLLRLVRVQLGGGFSLTISFAARHRVDMEIQPIIFTLSSFLLQILPPRTGSLTLLLPLSLSKLSSSFFCTPEPEHLLERSPLFRLFSRHDCTGMQKS